MKSKASRSVTFALLLLVTVALPTRASGAFVFTISPVGSDVLVNGSGSFNLSGLQITVPSASGFRGSIAPFFNGLFTGSSILVDEYRGSSVPITGPVNFGSSGQTLSTIDFGPAVGIRGPSPFTGSGGALYLPTGYISGTQLVSGSTYANHTLATLGLTPGTYVYTWGSDSVTLRIVPEPSTWALLGCGVVSGGVLFIRRRRRAFA